MLTGTRIKTYSIIVTCRSCFALIYMTFNKTYSAIVPCRLNFAQQNLKLHPEYIILNQLKIQVL